MELRNRVITAAGLSGVFFVLVLLAPFLTLAKWLLFLFGFVLVAVAAVEFAAVCTRNSAALNPARFGLYLIAAILPALFMLILGVKQGLFQAAECAAVLAALNAAFYLSFVAALSGMWLAARDGIESAARNMQELFVGVALIGFCGGALLSLVLLGDAMYHLIWLVLVVCVNDTAAYFFGSRVKGPKLSPALSPGKTISGALGGITCGALVGTLCFSFLALDASSGVALLFSLLVCVVAVLGDLAKSLIKRLKGVKDFGAHLPGHGGVLDRIDGLLAAAPLVLFWIVYGMNR